MKCSLSFLVLLSVSAWTEAGVVKRVSSDDEDEGELKMAQKLEKDNLDQNSVEVTGGVGLSHLRTPRDTKPCVMRDCMWPKAADGKVYIPYAIANHYTSRELDIIKRGLNSFSYSTCIRFFPLTNQTDFLYIQSLDGCYSYVGRQGNLQTLSLSRRGCVHHGMVQHELLHALGFNHEHCRSDRDQHIRVLLQNVIKGQEFNFRKVSSLNQRTPYDYNSVMHYGSLAFSKDSHSPTMEAVPDPNIKFGLAMQMSQGDIDRINLLYCTN